MSQSRILLTALQRITIQNRIPVLAFLLLCIFVGYLIYTKLTGLTHVNREFGYKITGPYQWEMEVSNQEKTVTYRKYQTAAYDNATIKFEVKIGNPYGQNALDYVRNGFVPQIEYTHQTMNQDVIDYRNPPYNTYRVGRDWGTVSFFINYERLQILYVTVEGDNIYILALNSYYEHDADEKLFYQVLDSVNIRERPGKYKFMEK